MMSRGLLKTIAVLGALGLLFVAPAAASRGVVPGTFKAEAVNRNGTVDTTAGSHPYAYNLSFQLEHNGEGVAEGNLRDVSVALPPGFVGNPNATPRCPRSAFDGELANCPPDTQIGTLVASIRDPGGLVTEPSGAVYNLEPLPGTAASFGFQAASLAVIENASVKAGGAGGYTVSVSSLNVPKEHTARVSQVIWGVPADKGHDSERECVNPTSLTHTTPCSTDLAPAPFLRLPTSCGTPQATELAIDFTEAPTELFGALSETSALVGCEALDFQPSISVRPQTSATSTPTGLQVDLSMPQEESPEGLAEADLKDAVVKLPAGVVVNPSQATGLASCSSAQIGLGSTTPPQCPAASQLGSVEVDTPLVDHPLAGAVYLASEGDNPFGSLLAIYIVIDDPQTGVVVKLAGHVELDPQTGQLTTTFSENPQLPFEHFKLDFLGGPRAPFVTPDSCGAFTTTNAFTPWTAPEGVNRTPSSSFNITESCSAPGFAPAFSAGTTGTQAGAYSPFLLTFSREDHEQTLSAVTVTMPPGLLGSLSSVAQCPEPQAASGNCGAESLIGETSVAVGTGPTPYWVTGGKVYLTGPYGGGPFGLSIVVPTTAGPLTLTGNAGFGKEVVRSSIRVDQHTSQITVHSDPLPTIIEGIPLQIRTVNVNVNRPGFMFTPTSCAEQGLTGEIASSQGAQSPVASRFQVGGCASLAFHPKFAASTQGNGSFNHNGASLTIKISTNQGPRSNPAIPTEANIKKVDVALPVQLPSRLTTLQKACTEKQFAANPAGCPPESNVGTATAYTPVLPVPLTGPAYLVSHGNAAFPDLDIILQGDGVTIVLTGNTNIKRGITYSRFDTNPDAPISSFELNLPERKFSVLGTDGTSLCKPTKTVRKRKRVIVRRHRRKIGITKTVTQHVPVALEMPTTITAQSGAVLKQTTKVAVTGCPKPKTAHSASRDRRAAHKRAKPR
jgi:hypothetical protein